MGDWPARAKESSAGCWAAWKWGQAALKNDSNRTVWFLLERGYIQRSFLIEWGRNWRCSTWASHWLLCSCSALSQFPFGVKFLLKEFHLVHISGSPDLEGSPYIVEVHSLIRATRAQVLATIWMPLSIQIADSSYHWRKLHRWIGLVPCEYLLSCPWFPSFKNFLSLDTNSTVACNTKILEFFAVPYFSLNGLDTNCKLS